MMETYVYIYGFLFVIFMFFGRMDMMWCMIESPHCPPKTITTVSQSDTLQYTTKSPKENNYLPSDLQGYREEPRI